MEHTLRLRKGAWTREEDDCLRTCIRKFGEGQWHQVPLRTGLNRRRKSCRLRWLNYLKPEIKRGEFAIDEVDLILKLHKLLGNRWSLIAGRLPGRTANDVKNYWNTKLRRNKCKDMKEIATPKITRHNIIRPRPHTFSDVNYFLVSADALNNGQKTTDGKASTITNSDQTDKIFIIDEEAEMKETNKSGSTVSEESTAALGKEEVAVQIGKNLTCPLAEDKDENMWETDLFVDDVGLLWDLLDSNDNIFLQIN